jgi:hypothetical protein
MSQVFLVLVAMAVLMLIFLAGMRVGSRFVCGWLKIVLFACWVAGVYALSFHFLSKPLEAAVLVVLVFCFGVSVTARRDF